MKSSDLRIGNLVDLGNRIAKVTEINHLACVVVDLEETQDTIEDYERVKGIILTEEWLLKFGFEIGYNQKKMLDVYCKDFGLLIERSNSNNFYYKKVNIHSVHQLQNLYFALTGEELILKE
jgi:hypothetical protein